MWTLRRRRRPLLLLVAGAALLVISAALEPEDALKVGFYHETCPIAEDVVLEEMRLILMEDDTVAPSLLRMHYHDCFVQGRDGSIMLRSRKKGRRSGTRSRTADCEGTTPSSGSRPGSRPSARSPSPAPTSSPWPPGTPSTFFQIRDIFKYPVSICEDIHSQVFTTSLLTKQEKAIVFNIDKDSKANNINTFTLYLRSLDKGRRLLGQQTKQAQMLAAAIDAFVRVTVCLICSIDLLMNACIRCCFVVDQSHGPWYDVETGRRDGNVTVAEYVDNDLPPPDSKIVDVKTFFSVKSLNSKDIAVLFGCHSIGTSHCGPIQKRLYNFTGNVDQDPSLDPAYAAELRKLCPPPTTTSSGAAGEGKVKVPLDPGSNYTFDLSYYRHVLATGGLFRSDGSLLHDPVTRGYVEKVAKAASPDEYYADFAAAMVKMGRTDVLVGDQGEIRPTCGIFVD